MDRHSKNIRSHFETLTRDGYASLCLETAPQSQSVPLLQNLNKAIATHSLTNLFQDTAGSLCNKSLQQFNTQTRKLLAQALKHKSPNFRRESVKLFAQTLSMSDHIGEVMMFIAEHLSPPPTLDTQTYQPIYDLIKGLHKHTPDASLLDFLQIKESLALTLNMATAKYVATNTTQQDQINPYAIFNTGLSLIRRLANDNTGSLYTTLRLLKKSHEVLRKNKSPNHATKTITAQFDKTIESLSLRILQNTIQDIQTLQAATNTSSSLAYLTTPLFIKSLENKEIILTPENMQIFIKELKTTLPIFMREKPDLAQQCTRLCHAKNAHHLTPSHHSLR